MPDLFLENSSHKSPSRIKQRFNCGHPRTPSRWHSTLVYTWDIHEHDEIVTVVPSETTFVYSCERLSVYQQRRGIKRFYIIEGESLPVTIIP